jgi:hypothetical protein
MDVRERYDSIEIFLRSNGERLKSIDSVGFISGKNQELPRPAALRLSLSGSFCICNN